MKLKKRSIKLHLLIIAAFNAAVFLPIIGRGFIHDDFFHLYSAAQDSLRQGLTQATGGPFFAPIAWLTFVADWRLWGVNPYPMAVENLLLHTLNTFLLYFFVLRLWKSRTAAWWAAVGFALLFPSTAWAVMWISTRAHLLVTFFYLAAMIAMLQVIRSERGRLYSSAAVILFTALALFSKENGMTLPLSLPLLMIYEKRANDRLPKIPALTVAAIFGAIFVLMAIYLWFRMNSGAVNLSFNSTTGYSYTLASEVISSNLLEYFWRTYGLLIILGGAIVLSQLVGRHRLYFDLLTKNEILFSLALFAVTISPVILLPMRSGIYTYLPGIAAAILLGAAARSLCQVFDVTTVRLRFATLFPILLITGVYTAFTVGHSLKWIQMAENTTTVLNQISARQPAPAPHTFFVLEYAEPDRLHRFPDGFSGHAFPFALRLHYLDPTLDGKIIRRDEARSFQESSSKIRLAYTFSGQNWPQVVAAVE